MLLKTKTCINEQDYFIVILCFPPAACVYNGASYSQGSHWFDGCDFRCVCEDATTDNYRCEQR